MNRNAWDVWVRPVGSCCLKCREWNRGKNHIHHQHCAQPPILSVEEDAMELTTDVWDTKGPPRCRNCGGEAERDHAHYMNRQAEGIDLCYRAEISAEVRQSTHDIMVIIAEAAKRNGIDPSLMVSKAVSDDVIVALWKVFGDVLGQYEAREE